MRLILIRHAESEHSQRGVIADITGCTGLTAAGVQQAHILQERFRVTHELDDCAALLCSPVRRTQQTAAIVAHGIPHCAVAEDGDLREILPGVADGMSWNAYRATYGAFELLAEPDRPFAPQGESWHVFLQRVHITLQRLADQYAGKTVIAVTHAGFIIASLFVTFAIPRPGTGARLDPRHTSLTVWEATAASWRLERYNDAWHIDALKQ